MHTCTAHLHTNLPAHQTFPTESIIETNLHTCTLAHLHINLPAQQTVKSDRTTTPTDRCGVWAVYTCGGRKNGEVQQPFGPTAEGRGGENNGGNGSGKKGGWCGEMGRGDLHVSLSTGPTILLRNLPNLVKNLCQRGPALVPVRPALYGTRLTYLRLLETRPPSARFIINDPLFWPKPPNVPCSGAY